MTQIQMYKMIHFTTLQTCSQIILPDKPNSYFEIPSIWLVYPPHLCTLLYMCEPETGIRWAPLIFHTTCFFI